MEKEWHENTEREKKQKLFKPKNDAKGQDVLNQTHKTAQDPTPGRGPVRVR